MTPWRAYDAWEARDRTLLEAAVLRREAIDRAATTLARDAGMSHASALGMIERAIRFDHADLLALGKRLGFATTTPTRYAPTSPDAEDT